MLDDTTFVLDEFNPQKIAKQITKNFKLRRLELNITQSELAEKSGVSLGSVKRFENTSEVSLKNLLLMAVVLNSTSGFLNLFSQKQYSNINELANKHKVKERKRARKK
jgi:transcriptional regulator with XRE-family HTH domain